MLKGQQVMVSIFLKVLCRTRRVVEIQLWVQQLVVDKSGDQRDLQDTDIETNGKTISEQL